MKQEDKELLLKDLCARLPYHPIFKINCSTAKAKLYGIEESFDKTYRLSLRYNDDEGRTKYLTKGISQCKMYLRPLSSMTNEERDEYESFVKSGYTDTGSLNGYYEYECVEINDIDKFVSWLDRKMFDHRKNDKGETMIEAGLALEAPADMYNDKK